jgi:two-component system OmpR family sensor kinase
MTTRLTIRARIAVSYGLVIATVLLVVAVAVSAVHQRIGMTRIDADLRADMQSVAGLVASEIDERLNLAVGAREAMYELELPGFGIMVLDWSGNPLATRVSGAPAVPVEVLRAAAVDAAPTSLATEHVRLAASSWSHREHNYRVAVWTSLVPFDREHATVQNTIRASIPFAALAALVGGWLFVWRALRPLAQMAAVADSIDRRRFDARLPVSAPRDELRRLAVAFNALLDRLSDVVQSQRRFMADASHELRTPVTIARTAAQVTLSAATRSEPEYREALDIISQQTDRLTHVVDDMFLLAVADVEGRPLVVRYLYLDELASECLRAAGVLAEQRAVSVTLQAQDGVQLEGDEELLRRMIMNLLDNAIRYSPHGGSVRVTVSAADDTGTVTVEDSGQGIPTAERDRIFERFVRLAPATGANGSGLGLPIARWIAEQHHGTLQLDGSNHGTRFVTRLPLKPPVGDTGSPSAVQPRT